MSGELRIAAIQHDIEWNDRDANFEHLAPMIRAAAGAGAGLVLCTETFSTGFAVDVPELGEPEGGPSSTFLAGQAREHGVWVGGSCPEVPPDAPADDQRPYNSFVLAGPDGTVHRYRKIHPFTFAGEEKWFRAGDRFVTVEIEGLRVSLFVCYDLRFADEFWQLALDTDVYLVPANWPAKRRLHWTVAAAGAGDREPGVRRRCQPGRRRGRARLQRRQPHRRSARRAAGDRRRDRDDPPRRRLRGASDRDPRPFPIPPRPSLNFLGRFGACPPNP